MSLNLDRSTWKRVKLGDVVLRSRTQIDPVEGGVDRYVAGGHVDTENVIIHRFGDVADGQMGSTFRYLFKPGQVLFVSARPYLRKAGVPDFTGVVADKTYVLGAAPGNGLLHDILPFLLTSDRFVEYATQEATGSMNPRLLWGAMQRYEFDLPPLDEQRRMADLLWAVERERDAVRILLGEVDATTSVWLNEVFDRDSVTERPMGEMLDICQYGLSARAGETGAYPMLRMTNLGNGGVTDLNLKYCDLSESDFKSYRVHDGDVLFNRTNSVELVGRSGIFRLDGDFVFASYLVRLRSRPDELMPDYMNEFINSLIGQRRIRVHLSKGVSQANISASKLRTVKIPVPPIDRQREFVMRLDALRKRRSTVADRLTSVSNLAQRLQIEIFGGAA